ncbi:MAG: hypothetical protein VCE74_20195, partial [Alphaproteobacteria bacterium]
MLPVGRQQMDRINMHGADYVLALGIGHVPPDRGQHVVPGPRLDKDPEDGQHVGVIDVHKMAFHVEPAAVHGVLGRMMEMEL